VEVEHTGLVRQTGQVFKIWKQLTRRVPPAAQAMAVLAICLLMTWLAWNTSRQNLVNRDRQKFARLSDAIENSIADQMQSYVLLIEQARAFAQMNPDLKTDEWTHYVAMLRIRQQFTGLQGLGIAEYVPRSEASTRLLKIKSRRNEKSFTIWPSGDRSLYVPVILIEPMDWRNQRAIGYDMYSESIRAQAIDLAARSGRPQMTGLITLVQETERATQPGLIIYSPVYEGLKVPDTEDMRLKKLVRFVYAPFRAHNLFQSIRARARLVAPDSDFDFEVFAHSTPKFPTESHSALARLIYDHDHLIRTGDSEKSWRVHQERIIEILGQRFSIHIYSLPGFHRADPWFGPKTILFLGLVLSSLVTTIIGSNAHQARLLERSETQTQLLVDATTILNSSLEAENTLSRFCDVLTRDWVSFVAVDLAGDDLKLKRLAEKSRFHIPLSASVDHISEALSSRQPVLREGWLVIPMMARGRAIGCLSLCKRGQRPEVFRADDIDLGRELARRVSLAIENMRLFREAQTANRAKDEFLATVSHELRTPMNVILGWIEIMASEQLSPESLRQALSTVEKNARVQIALINDLLDISRIISGKLVINPRRTNLQDVIETAINSVQPAARAKAIDCRLSNHCQDPITEADPDRMHQVLWNLLTNAIKFTPAGGTVIVDVSCDKPGALQISVKDTGQGIEPQFLPYVFDRFRQEDGGTTRQHGGLGIGLAIVRYLVELHGGTVSVRSQGRGMGSCFTVELPLLGQSKSLARGPSDQQLNMFDRAADLRQEAVSPDASQALQLMKSVNGKPADENLSLKGVRLLVVDDSSDVRALLERVLRRAGADVKTAENADEALKLTEKYAFDLIISDIGLPGTDGYELMKRIRARESILGISRVPAMALTAYAQEKDAELAHRAGYDQHLAKPVSSKNLVRAVSELRPI